MINIPVSEISGIGESRSKLLLKLGIKTVNDMLYFVPRQMEDRSEIKQIKDLRSGETAAVFAELITEVEEMRIRNNLVIYKAVASDGSGAVMLNWFNNKYIKSSLKKGQKYKFYGKVEYKYGKFEMSGITYEKADGDTYIGRVVPIYPLTKNLPQKTMQSLMRICVEKYVGTINEYINEDIRKKYGLCEINFALRAIHFPCGKHEYEIARKRLIFEELMLFQLGILKVKKRKPQGEKFNTEGVFAEFAEMLPFELTAAQKNVIGEIYADLSGNVGMNRLVQGDVGSGKTAVAFAAMYAAYKNGFQSALMAPTEVLASQHFNTAKKYFADEEIAYLSGSVTGKQKSEEILKIKSGKAKIIIGTHALLESNVEFKNLRLVITDEQHRFGVKQRLTLSEKGDRVHILIMSATPIPRTLALIIYGDLDISVIDSVPPGRQKISTYIVDESMRTRINNFIIKNIEEGRQVYIICPLASESEKIDIKAAEELAEELSVGALAKYNVSLLHGKMRPKEKNEIMRKFADGETDVLVSTTVIEVGINVPNASVMIIENAERFGLSQLHQIRGRVGRGEYRSYCVLFSQDKNNERLKVLAQTNDGFEVARKDLALRGPGDFLGTRQHGLPEFKIADLETDLNVMKNAGNAAKEILEKDPELKNNMFLKEKLNEMFKTVISGNITG